jgi:hypothetical protein
MLAAGTRRARALRRVLGRGGARFVANEPPRAEGEPAARPDLSPLLQPESARRRARAALPALPCTRRAPC